VYVATWDGAAQVLDGRTGRPLCREQARPDLSAIAVAARRGQVLVTSLDGSGDRPADPWAWVPAGLRERLPWLAGSPSSATLAAGSGAVTVATTTC
jgi:hypothetical protein